MVTNDELLGLALNALEPAETEAVRAKLKDDTAAQVNLARIEKLLVPLAADREHPAPPEDLVLATLRRFDAGRAQTRPRAMVAGRWLELAVAASIGLVAFGLVATGMSRWKTEQHIAACQNNLRAIGVGLNNYADRHENKFPQIGSGEAPSAEHFSRVLDQEQHWPASASRQCPADPTSSAVGYTYSLGHRVGDQLIGPRRDLRNSPATTPIVADLPSAAAGVPGSTSPHLRGHNVLFADGHTMFSISAMLGDDHIFLNDKGEARAGCHLNDMVLGHPGDIP